jgi:hypothetical protein
MSLLIDTKHAYVTLAQLLDQEIRKRIITLTKQIR